MDRRQKKTREAIFQAFGRLLEKKPYRNITVQEIIEEADIGRTTFYAHFETKDELLHVLCTDIFHHVFTQILPQEKSPQGADRRKNLELKLGHILYHLSDNSNVKRILQADGDGLFIQYFRQYLFRLFTGYRDIFQLEVPEDFLIPYLVGSFTETVKWWFSSHNSYTPEEVARFYMKTLHL